MNTASSLHGRGPLRDRIAQMYARLKRIFRGEETYGDAEQAVDQARQYRLEEVLPLVVENIRATYRAQKTPVDLLVSLSGFSPDTTVLAYELLRPERLLIIQSENAAESTDVIMRNTGISAGKFERHEIDPNEPLEIYRVVREAAERIRRRRDGRANVVIDITGGKKIMSAAAALAATQLDLSLCYIDGRYDPALRQPEPGTEELIILPNPTELFEDREMDVALSLLAHGDFPAGHHRFHEIAERSLDPAKARFGRDLASCYLAWSDFDRERLPDRIETLRKRLRHPVHRPSREVQKRIETQLEFLTELDHDPDGPNLTLNYFLVGRHYGKRERHEFAVLLYYRTLEHLWCRHLEQRAQGFDCAKPDWSLLHDDRAELEDRYKRVADRTYPSEVWRLPGRVGLMDAAILLAALEDPVVPVLGLAAPKSLRHLMTMAEKRNRSVLAHGSQSIDRGTSEDFENYVLAQLRNYWGLRPGAPKLDPYLADLAFVESI